MASRQRYRVIEKIDMGGMAEIYRARAVSLEGIEKEVAIKRVLPQLTKNRKFVAMFLDEARLSMHLNHAHIVQIFDVGRAEGTYFIVMEFVDGYNLRRIFQQAVDTNQPVPVEISAFIMSRVCEGLAHAHEKRDTEGKPLNIVHRDVSPPNILVSRSGEVKLTDFGLAKAASHLESTDPGVVKGKFSYLSPEATEGQPLDHRADIFAVGIVLFELLTNRRLFLGKSDVETIDMVRQADIPSVSRLNPKVPARLESIVNRALARDPRKRFPSAGEMGNALMECLFAENLKASSYDVSQYLKRLFDPGGQDSFEERIDKLIQEEVLNLSSLRYGVPFGEHEGAEPVRLEEMSTEFKSTGRIPLDAIWPSTHPDSHTGFSPKLRSDYNSGLSPVSPMQYPEDQGSWSAPLPSDSNEPVPLSRTTIILAGLAIVAVIVLVGYLVAIYL